MSSAISTPTGNIAPINRDVVVREIEKAMRIDNKMLREAAKQVAISFADVVRGKGGDTAEQVAMVEYVARIAGEMLDEIGAR